MKKGIISTAMLTIALCVGVSTTVSALYMMGNTSLGLGTYNPGGTNGYDCTYSEDHGCIITGHHGTGIDVRFMDDWLSLGIVRMEFSTPYSSSTLTFTANTQLPPTTAAQMGSPTAHILPGVYPVVYTAACPNGYVDLNWAP